MQCSASGRSGQSPSTDWHLEMEDRFVVGDKVVSICHESGHGAASGVPVDRVTGYVHTFRDGQGRAS